MWNFAYPYQHKQLIDLACQRNMLLATQKSGRRSGRRARRPRRILAQAATALVAWMLPCLV